MYDGNSCDDMVESDDQVKVIRTWDGATSGWPTGYNVWRYSGGSEEPRIGMDGCPVLETGSNGYEMTLNSWVIEEVEFDQGTTTPSSGSVHWWNDGITLADRSYTYKCASQPSSWNSFWFHLHQQRFE